MPPAAYAGPNVVRVERVEEYQLPPRSTVRISGHPAIPDGTEGLVLALSSAGAERVVEFADGTRRYVERQYLSMIAPPPPRPSPAEEEPILCRPSTPENPVIVPAEFTPAMFGDQARPPEHATLSGGPYHGAFAQVRRGIDEVRRPAANPNPGPGGNAYIEVTYFRTKERDEDGSIVFAYVEPAVA
jgi:hypothetical protein